MQPTEVQAQAAYDRICSSSTVVGIDELVERPLMTDPTSRAILDVLAKVTAECTGHRTRILCP